MENKINLEIERIKDDGKARQDKTETKRIEHSHEQKMVALSMISKELEKAPNLNQNTFIATMFLIQGIITEKGNDKTDFDRFLLNVLKQLPQTVEQKDLIEHLPDLGFIQFHFKKEEMAPLTMCIMLAFLFGSVASYFNVTILILLIYILFVK